MYCIVRKILRCTDISMYRFTPNAYTWDMYVADIPGGGLLGLDFLFHHNYTLNKEGLLLDGHLVRCEIEGEPMLCAASVTLQEDVVVPATSQCVALGEADVTAFRSSIWSY